MKKFLLLIVSALLSAACFSQELNCTVVLNHDQIQGTNQTVFNTLRDAITSFMNDRRWTDYAYKSEERIECSMSILVNSYSNGSFSCQLQVQSTRPVFGSSYKSPLFAHLDDSFAFTYNEGDVLQFTEGSFGNNLTEVLAYYAYLIIALDCDSFSPFGGTPFYQKAEQIVNGAQSTNEAGWRAFEDHRNRYALINNYLGDAFRPFRQYVYDYHRRGLDQMNVSPDKGRAEIVSGIGTLRDVYKARPSAIAISEFASAKIDELVNICSKGSAEERKTVYDVMSVVAPTMGARLEKLK